MAHLAPITGRMAELMADPAEIDRILGDGAERAAAIAEPILARTYDIVGLVRSRSGASRPQLRGRVGSGAQRGGVRDILATLLIGIVAGSAR